MKRRAPIVLAMFVICAGLCLPVAAEDGAIAPGDTLRITVLGEADLTREVVVDARGKINIPLVGEVQVTGLTSARAAEVLRAELSRFVLRPDVTVDIIATAVKNVVVAGAVNNPGAYSVDATARLMDAIALAGGSLPYSNLTQVSITRGKDKTTRTYDLAMYRETADNVHNPLLEAGDIITVTEMVPVLGEVFLSGEVADRGVVPLREGMTVRDAIGAAGGLTENADPTNATIKRAGYPTTVPLDLVQAMQGNPTADLDLKNGDFIFVPAIMQLGTISVFGEVNRPGSYPARGSVLITDAIALAGGFSQRAKPSDVRITRVGSAPVIVDVGKIVDGVSENPEIRAGDTVYVSRGRERIDVLRVAGIAVSIGYLIVRMRD